MKKSIALILLLLLTLVIFGYKWSLSGAQEGHIKTIEVTHSSEVKLNDTSTIEAQIQETAPDKNFNMQETGEESKDTIKKAQTLSPFLEEDMDDMKLQVKPLEGIEPLSAISIEKNIISNSKVGDIIVLPSIDGSYYEMIIKGKNKSAMGNVSIYGDYMENGIAYHSILTEGKQSSYISMTTPEGTYEVNLINGKGYVYSSVDIENKKIDYTKSDTIEVLEEEDKERHITSL